MKNIHKIIICITMFCGACGGEIANKEVPKDAYKSVGMSKPDSANMTNSTLAAENPNSSVVDTTEITSDTQVAEATGKPPKDIVPILPEMIKVKGGSFHMGSKDTEAKEDEGSIHEVKVGDFYIGKFEITVGQFSSFVEITGYQSEAEKIGKSYVYTGSWKNMKGVNWRHDARGNLRPPAEYNHPVIHVSWNDADAYCKWLSSYIKKPFRLLTEAEWEFAARGGLQSKNTKYSGSTNTDEIAWYISSSGDKGTFPVGTKKANELKIHDLSGNVYEWCADWYDSEYYATSPTDNPKGAADGTSRVVRGGSWHDTADKSRVASRFNGNPSYCGYNIGFRVARSQ